MTVDFALAVGGRAQRARVNSTRRADQARQEEPTTVTNDIERLASDLIAQHRGAASGETYQTSITLSSDRPGYVVFYTLTWSPRVKTNELGLPEIAIEAIAWQPVDPYNMRTTQEFSRSGSDIVESASRLLWPAVMRLFELGHGVVSVGPQHRVRGWNISSEVGFGQASGTS